MFYDCELKFSDLVGHTLVSARQEDGRDGDELVFETTEGQKWILYHPQDCCESVYIEDIAGDLLDLVGSPITQAEEVSGETPELDYEYESYTWTFYKIATIKGSVTVRWFGYSNGYYSESVYLRVE